MQVIESPDFDTIWQAARTFVNIDCKSPSKIPLAGHLDKAKLIQISRRAETVNSPNKNDFLKFFE